MASEFLGDGPVYQEEFASGERRVVDARAGGLATDPAIDVAVLIDGGTASASEIVAGALGDRDRATLVGETTFGKGTIQEWTELPGDNGGFRLSVAHWLLPDGTAVDGVGVAPDIAVVGRLVALGSTTTSLDDDPVVRAAIDALIDDGAASRQPRAVGPAGRHPPPRRHRPDAAARRLIRRGCALALAPVVGLLFAATKGGDVQ